MIHDRFCELSNEPCCPWLDDCRCQCICEEIRKIREDEKRVTRLDHS